KLFKSLSNNSNIESGSNIVQRLMKLDALLKGLNCDSVLIITHGFLLRFLDIYYQKKSKVFDEKTLNNVTNYDFLSGFTVITNF
ncbi:MAG TPA: hypothetical protein DCE80_06430, partial [Ignavibacteriales bacterium]|nr:hypothetical protein [Ignavibacteriales bacterium]